MQKFWSIIRIRSDLARFIENKYLKTLSEVGCTEYKVLVRCQNWYRSTATN